jgi:hypothetical protein
MSPPLLFSSPREYDKQGRSTVVPAKVNENAIPCFSDVPG